MDQAGQIREKIDLVSLISEYIPLKKAGANFKANCPFHQENTPSFVVSPERQIWHCFGCGKGGDAFSFLMEYENMEFPEALRVLAKKAGVTLKESSYEKGISSQKEKIFKLNSLASKFYNFLLTEHKVGKEALNYLLKKRGLNVGLIKTYSLGFSPGDNSLSKFLVDKKGYKKDELVEAGLAYFKNSVIMDFFRGRIMFPLTDHRGNIVGFSGRALSDTEPSKYINTKETAVYHKGSLFFGLDSAKEEIKKEGAIVVEGEFDVLSSFKEGIKNIVAIKGTALTENQANLLSRFTKKVTLCLDKDSAGFEATKRSLEPLEKSGMIINIVNLSEKDPDEQIKKNSSLFKKSLKEAEGVYDFLLAKTLETNDTKTAQGLENITRELLPYLSQITNEVVKEHYIKKLAQKLDVSMESLNKELLKLENNKKIPPVIAQNQTSTKRNRREIAEEFLVAMIIQSDNPKEVLDDEKKFFKIYQFENPAYKKIIDNLNNYFEKRSKFNPKEFADFMPEELSPAFDICFLMPGAKFESKEKYEREANLKKEELLRFFVTTQMNYLGKSQFDKGKQKEIRKKMEELQALYPRE